MDNVLLYFSLKYQGNWEAIYAALDKKEKINHDDFLEQTTNLDSNFVSIINPLYPSNLKNSHKPPFVLFVEGDLNLISNYHQIIGISGDRDNNEYGLSALNMLISDFKKENRIVLIGDEAGIELAAIEEAADNKTKIILVTSKGLRDFAKNNTKLVGLLRKTEYLIISESYANLASETDESKDYYYRLKAGIAKAFVIIQTKMKSECMNVVNYALNDGKDIFVIPEDINSKYKGSNYLIKQGAKLVENTNDILNEL